MTDEQRCRIRELLEPSGISPEESAGEDWDAMDEADAAVLIETIEAITPDDREDLGDFEFRRLARASLPSRPLGL